MNNDISFNVVQSMTKLPMEVVDQSTYTSTMGPSSLSLSKEWTPSSVDSFVTKLCSTLSMETSIPKASNSSTGCKEKAGFDAPTKVLTMS